MLFLIQRARQAVDHPSQNHRLKGLGNVFIGAQINRFSGHFAVPVTCHEDDWDVLAQFPNLFEQNQPITRREFIIENHNINSRQIQFSFGRDVKELEDPSLFFERILNKPSR